MDSPIEISEVVTWPQAIVAVAVVIAVLVVPQIVSLLQNKGIKHQFTNNSGTTMRDAIDRIEKTLTDHVEASAAREAEVDERLAQLERTEGALRR